MDENKQLYDLCVSVLERNKRGNHTQPASGFYPHQWLWDSCFIAIGLRHTDIERAKLEIESLLEGQWANGMVPHIIFDNGKAWKLDRNMWKSWVSPFSPDTLNTSGITQPPMIAEAVWRVGEKMPKAERIQWFKKILPALIRHHEWLYNERDPHHEGLVLQIHPYETGLDSTPPWVKQLHEHSKPWWIDAIELLKLDKAVNIIRRDTRHAPPGQRMTNIDALLYWNAIRRFRKKSWDINKILHRTLFCIEDVSFNSILTRANKRLELIAKTSRVKLPEHLVLSINKTVNALDALWDESTDQFYSRDFITHELLKEPTVAGLLPIYANGVAKNKVQKLVDLMRDHRQFWTHHPIPSVPLTSSYFDAHRYWQGPTWVNTNWLIIDGLNRHGHNELAKELKEKTIEMVKKSGVFEYYSPLDGKPLGASDFSWTAALVIDLLTEDK